MYTAETPNYSIHRYYTMKNLLLMTLFCAITSLAHGQEITDDLKKSITESLQKQMIKESAGNACKCIDSINAGDKSSEQMAKEINECIDKEMMAYQMIAQLGSFKMKLDNGELEEKPKNSSDEKLEHSIVINTNKESTDYKLYYYELERYLMDSCAIMKRKVASNNKLGNYSMSNNMLALRWYEKGGYASEAKNYDKAVEYYTKALKVDSMFAFAWDNLGIAYRRLSNYDKAIECYKKSIQIDPKGTMPLQNLAVAYQYKKEYDNAVKAYEQLATVDDKNPEVYYGLGNIYAVYMKDYEKGLDNLCKAYVLYLELKSPYRTDAETMISQIYAVMKNEGNTERFNEIMIKYNMTPVK